MTRALFAFLAASIAIPVPVAATIISGTVTGGTGLTAGGHFVKLTPPLANPFGPPDSVGNANFQSPNLFAFDEDQNIVLTAPLTVDVGSSPIPAGTIVASHYVLFDPGPTEQVIGTVNFDSDVLAILTSTTHLAASDFLANTGVKLPESGPEGLGSRRLGNDQRRASDPVRHHRKYAGRLRSGADGLLARRRGVAGTGGTYAAHGWHRYAGVWASDAEALTISGDYNKGTDEEYSRFSSQPVCLGCRGGGGSRCFGVPTGSPRTGRAVAGRRLPAE